MPIFHVQFSTNTEIAQTAIEAATLDEALDKALDCDPETLCFEPFASPRVINKIVIMDNAGVELVWRDDDLLLRLAADDLLIAAKNVLTALKLDLLANCMNRCTKTTLDHLKEAVGLAEGRGK